MSSVTPASVPRVMQPNIVFIHVDDQRFDTIAALGNRQIRTPNLDWLVQRGTAFTHTFIPGGTSQAVCMPSRAMLHTGRTLFHLQGAGETIAPEHTTLGQALRSAGYQTFGAGKWHIGTESFHRSFSAGGEIFFGGMADHWNVPVFHFDPTGKYDKRLLFVENPMRSNVTQERNGDHIHVGRHSTDIITDAGLRFLKEHRADQPYFLHLCYLAPHDPRTMPREFLDLYDPAQIELPKNFLPQHPFDNGEMSVRDELLAASPRTEAEIRRHIAEYYAMISHIDDRVGKIVSAVRDRGELDRTLFIYGADHGLALGQHGLMGKQNLYEHSLRVPLILSGPGVPAGKINDDLVYMLDLFPTICDLTGTAVPTSVQGQNLLSHSRDTLYLAYLDKHRGVRTRQHKLIEYVVDGRHSMTQVFDLLADPLETHNIADNTALVEKLRRELFRLRDEWNDRDSKWGQTFWAGYEM